MVGYIGKSATVGNFVKLDSITTSATTTFNLLNGGVAYSPESARHCLVSLNGVIQNPETSFNIVNSTIVFSQALTSDDVIDYILVLGDVMSVGTPSDATVSTAKLVDSAVTTAKVNDSAITTAKINDDAVTVDKLNLVSTGSAPSLEAKGTSGVTEGYIQLNCAENSHGIKLKSPPHSAGASYTLTFPTTDGNADEFLQTNGSGTLTWAEAGGGAYTKLLETTISNHTELIFNNTYFTSTYQDFMFAFSDFDVGTDSTRLRFRVSTDNGSNYITASEYRFALRTYKSDNTTNSRAESSYDYFEVFPDTLEYLARENANFTMHIYNPLSSSTNFSWSANGHFVSSGNLACPFYAGGYWTNSSSTAVNCIKFYMSSGDIDQGKVTMYGRKS